MIEINFSILAAQIVTFLIGVALLWKISWGPLTKLMKERSSVIEKELQAAQQSRAEAKKLEETYRQELSVIESKAKEMMSRTLAEAQATKEQILKSGQEEFKKLMEKTKESLEAERVRLIEELRGELSHLVVMGSERLLKQAIDREQQERWSREFLKELEQHVKKS